MFYQVEKASLCDICEGEECAEKCAPQAQKQQADKDTKESKDVLFKEATAGSTTSSFSSAIALVFAFICARMF